MYMYSFKATRPNDFVILNTNIKMSHNDLLSNLLQVCEEPSQQQGGLGTCSKPPQPHLRVQIFPITQQLRYFSPLHPPPHLWASSFSHLCLCACPADGSVSGNVSTSSSCSETYTSYSDIKPWLPVTPAPHLELHFCTILKLPSPPQIPLQTKALVMFFFFYPSASCSIYPNQQYYI